MKRRLLSYLQKWRQQLSTVTSKSSCHPGNHHQVRTVDPAQASIMQQDKLLGWLMKCSNAGNNSIWVYSIHIHSGLWWRRGRALTSFHLACYTCHLLSFTGFTVISLLYWCEESLRVQWHTDLIILLLNYYCSQIMIHQWHWIRNWMIQDCLPCESVPSKIEIAEAIKQHKNGKSEEPI